MTPRKMDRTSRLATTASLLGLALTLGSCSLGGADKSDGGGALFIETCTLGCSSGAAGTPVNCQILNVHVNEEIIVTFSEPVNISTVNEDTFRVELLPQGGSPPGTYFLDPSNNRRVIYRPALSFNTDGSPVFGLESQATYRIFVAGEQQGDTGPFIRSQAGRRNTTRLDCTVSASLGTNDSVPGQPTATVFVDLADITSYDASGFPTVIVEDQFAPGAVDVFRNSDILINFNDLMNPASLADPLSGTSEFIRVFVDADGVLSDPSDQVRVDGVFQVSISPELLTSTVLFTPFNGFPSAGSDLANPRQIVVRLSPTIQDLAGNLLSNAGDISFTPEIILFDPLTFPDADGEGFENTLFEDGSSTGAQWSTAITGYPTNVLSLGRGGGSGRLGDVHVPAGGILTLNTNSQSFPLTTDDDGFLQAPSIIDNAIPVVDYDPTDKDSFPGVLVEDGVFEFSSLTIELGGVLRFEGTVPARLLISGPCVIDGTIDVAGQSAPNRDSSEIGIAVGADGGPNAGRGGRGGSRQDYTGNVAILGANGGSTGTACNDGFPAGGISNPTGMGLINGAGGQGIGLAGVLGAGKGGTHFPDAYPIGTSGAGLNDFAPTTEVCESLQVGTPGAGGAYADDGGAGIPVTLEAMDLNGNPNFGAASAGGSYSSIGIELPGANPLVRKLEWKFNNLRGGAGGGGGGGHIFGSRLDGVDFECDDVGLPPLLCRFRDHAGAAGGGGGGALHLISGQRITVNGTINAKGGNGGSALNAAAGLDTHKVNSAPGGGGSGGAIRLQALDIDLFSLPGRIDVAGGLGGTWLTTGATGGNGAPGLVRLEVPGGAANLDPDLTATRIGPAPITSCSVPHAGLPNHSCWLSVGNWGISRDRPESYTAAYSCWMRAEGNFFELEFQEDGISGLPEDMGWNFDVIWDNGVDGPIAYPWRGVPSPVPPGHPFAPMSFEEAFGNELNLEALPNEGSPIAARFQGAVATGDLSDPCDVTLVGIGMEIAPDSLTPWVRHPSELGLFSPPPNMIRYTIIFDYGVAPGTIVSIKGIDNLRIEAQPD